MGQGCLARGGDRGGEVVQAPRPPLARVAIGSVAIASALALSAWSVSTAGRVEAQLIVCGIAAAAVLGASIVGRWPELAPWPIASLGGLYAAALLVRDGGIDGFAPLYAAGLIATAELTYWAIDRAPAAGGRAIVLRRVGAIAALASGSAVAGAAVLAISDAAPARGFGVELLGVLAAVGAVALLAWLAWDQR